LLLAVNDAVDGLSPVRFATYPEFAGLAEGFWEWRDGGRPRLTHRAGANRLVVIERPGFVQRAADCAADVVGSMLEETGTTPADVDLLVATPEPGFADIVADLVDIDRSRTLHAGERIGRMHTAQLIAAIDYARRNGRWAQARTILLVSAGAGITAAAALYRH
jgi:3-oxoacyl-[acyl-carrier-protein] synthase III